MNENTKRNKEYSINRYQKRKRKYRIKLGLETFIQYPVLNLIWIALTVITVKLTILLYKKIEEQNIPRILEPVYKYLPIIVVIVVFGVIVYAILYEVAEHIAKDDEANIREAFEENELNDMPPILKSKRKIKKHIYKRTFYTNIPVGRWNELIEEIQVSTETKRKGEIEGGETSREITITSIDVGEKDESEELSDEEL